MTTDTRTKQAASGTYHWLWRKLHSTGTERKRDWERERLRDRGCGEREKKRKRDTQRDRQTDIWIGRTQIQSQQYEGRKSVFNAQSTMNQGETAVGIFNKSSLQNRPNQFGFVEDWRLLTCTEYMMTLKHLTPKWVGTHALWLSRWLKKKKEKKKRKKEKINWNLKLIIIPHRKAAFHIHTQQFAFTGSRVKFSIN